MRSTAASSSGAPSVMNRVTMWPGPYRVLDLGDSIRRADRTAIRGSRQIAVPQGIAECPALVREDGHQVADPAKLGFQDRVGMPGNQIHDTGRGAQASEVARAVQRMEACPHDTGCVPDVMQPCGRDQDFAAQRQRRRQMLGLARDTLHVRPSPGQRFGQDTPCHLPSLAHHDHDGQPTQDAATEGKHQHYWIEQYSDEASAATTQAVDGIGPLRPGLTFLLGSVTPAGGVSVQGNAGGDDQSRAARKSTVPPEK